MSSSFRLTSFPFAKRDGSPTGYPGSAPRTPSRTNPPFPHGTPRYHRLVKATERREDLQRIAAEIFGWRPNSPASRSRRVETYWSYSHRRGKVRDLPGTRHEAGRRDSAAIRTSSSVQVGSSPIGTHASPTTWSPRRWIKVTPGLDSFSGRPSTSRARSAAGSRGQVASGQASQSDAQPSGGVGNNAVASEER